jgi:hypothetical protein
MIRKEIYLSLVSMLDKVKSNLGNAAKNTFFSQKMQPQTNAAKT